MGWGAVPSLELSGGHRMWKVLRIACDCGPGIFKASPADGRGGGEGHPVSSASRLNEAHRRGVMPVEAVAYASGLPGGAGRRVAQAGARRAPRVRAEGWREVWARRLGLLPAPLPAPPHSGTSRSVGAGGVSGRARAAFGVRARGAPDSWQLRARRFRGLCCACLLVLSHVNLVNRPDLLPRLNA